MAVAPIPVDQRVIGIDSRRFASIEKALVELITNSDDSYSRREASGERISGRIDIAYERHHGGAVIEVTDRAEGMSFEQASRILAYGGAHSPLSRGEGGDGRGYFGRGLKQAVFGLGSGAIETIRDGRFTRIELFRADNGGYLYDDGDGDRPATAADRERLAIDDTGTRVTLVVENPHVVISQFQTVVRAACENIYLREVLARRTVEIVHVAQGREREASGRLRFDEPAATVLIGPDAAHSFAFDGAEYPFTITLKRASNTELTTSGDERTNGLVVVSGLAVLDCQLFEYENQVGTEYLFGTVRCRGLVDKLAEGQPIISDEREGLNRKDPFVAAFSRAVSGLLAEHVMHERDALKHLEHATTSPGTAHMIEGLLRRMSESAVRDLGVGAPPVATSPPVPEALAEPPFALRFTTPFYYRKPGRPFHVALLVDTAHLAGNGPVTVDYALPASMRVEPAAADIAVDESPGVQRVEWTIVGDTPGERGEITARAGAFWAWCEVVIAEPAPSPPPGPGPDPEPRPHRPRPPHDHGEDMFVGYELRYLGGERDRAVYSPEDRTIIINTGDPTVQLYLDGRGRFRDSARLLLAELFLDVIAGVLARRLIERSGRDGDPRAYHEAKHEIIRRYGAEVHRSLG